MIKDEIKYLVFSDVHFGHNKTPTEFIINNLNNLLLNYKDRKDIKIIFIAGDLFDRLLVYPNNIVSEITIWVSRLLEFCVEKNIILRILEGTPSHDWKQSKCIIDIAKILKLPVDVDYITTLKIETIEHLNLTILYIPDEYKPDSNQTYSEVLDLMKSLNLNKIDIGIFHGQFKYQLPFNDKNNVCHNEENYLAIIKHFINIGHIHNFSTYNRIIAQGSVDRIRHDEEAPKGMVECVIRPDMNDRYYFIENKNAKVYKTIEIKTNNLDKAINQIKKTLSKIPIDSFIRIKTKKNNPAYLGLNEIKKLFPMYSFSRKAIDEEAEIEKQKLIENENNVYTPIDINKENIEQLLLDVITKKYELTDKQLGIFKNLFGENR